MGQVQRNGGEKPKSTKSNDRFPRRENRSQLFRPEAPFLFFVVPWDSCKCAVGMIDPRESKEMKCMSGQ